jgi:hypothetical protein
VALSQRLRRRQVKDGRVDAMGCIGPCYPTFTVFNVLGARGIVVIQYLLGPIYITLEGWGSLSLLYFSYRIS